MADRPVNLPRRLYGRQAEKDRIETLLADPAARVVVVSGPAGVGKSALIAAVLTDAAAAGALTGAGKHAQGEDSEDLAPFIEAMEQAVTAGLEQLYDPDAGMETLAAALGTKAAVFATFGSGLFRSLKTGPLAAIYGAEAAEERITQACTATLRWLHGFDQPIVLQIDDWGRASERTTRLYERLIAEPDLARLRILASERPDEPSPLRASQASVEVVVGPLDTDAQRLIVADMLADEAAELEPILARLGAATKLPFDLIQGVRGLTLTRGLVNREGGWVLDPAAQAAALASAVPESTLINLISDRPGQLAMLQALALCGDTAELSAVAASSGQSATDAEASLSSLEQAGLARRSGRRVSLTHDRVRSAALQTLDPTARRALSGRLAETLRAQRVAGDETLRATMLWRRLDGGLDDIDAAGWAVLFEGGAREARELGDRRAVDAFAESALALAERAGTATSSLVREAVVAAVERFDYELAARRAELMIQLSTDLSEQIDADVIRVFATRRAGDLDQAVKIAREAVARIGIHVPLRPSAIDAVRAIGAILLISPRWARRQEPYTKDELAAVMPRVRAAHVARSLLSAQEVLVSLVAATRTVPPEFASRTAAGASTYACLCAMLGLYRKAGEWAALADDRQSDEQVLRALAMQYAKNFGHWFTRPHRDLLDLNDEIERLAYAEGDLAVAASAERDRVMDTLMAERPLAETIRQAERSEQGSERFKAFGTHLPIAATHQAALNLMNDGEAPQRLEGAIFSTQAFGATTDPALGNATALIAMLEAILAVSFGAYEAAAEIHQRRNRLFRASPFLSRAHTWTFTTGLALYRTGGRPSRISLFNLRRVAKLNPTDNAHRIALLDAEATRLAGRERRAMALYERAVEAARQSSSWIEAGIVAGAAAEGAAMLGRPEADRFSACALEAWRKLGAAGVIAVRHAAARPAPAQVAELDALRAEVSRLEQRQQERETELETARLAAERANRAKSRFLAAIGHELRTPLQGLVGLVDLSRETGENLDMETLGSVVGQFRTVVNDLTDLGALEGGVFPLGQRPFDPAETCRGVVRLHEPSLRDSERSLKLTTPRRSVVVQGDEGRVAQIVSNLIGNAVKHARGDIEVRLRTRAAGLAATLTINVADEGPGLDEAALTRLFEPFERGDAAATTEGLGLGLPLARALARRMGGDIRVSRTPSGGSCFQLEFDAALAQGAKTPASAPLAGARVLLAEDAPLSRRVIAALLRAQGCDIAEAADGQAALDLWRAGGFDLVLLDLRMPVMDGLAVAREIRAKAEPGDALTTIVIATAAASPKLEQAAKALKVAAVLQKPIGWRDIAQVLGRLTEPAETNRLDELRAALGDDADAMIAEAHRTVAAAAGRIRALAQAGDSWAVKLEAHRLAGLASTFGMDRLARAALDLEAEAGTRASARALAAVDDALGLAPAAGSGPL